MFRNYLRISLESVKMLNASGNVVVVVGTSMRSSEENAFAARMIESRHKGSRL